MHSCSCVSIQIISYIIVKVYSQYLKTPCTQKPCPQPSTICFTAKKSTSVSLFLELLRNMLTPICITARPILKGCKPLLNKKELSSNGRHHIYSPFPVNEGLSVRGHSHPSKSSSIGERDRDKYGEKEATKKRDGDRVRE